MSPASKSDRPHDAFAFGRNWQRYVDEYLSPERIEIAAQSLRELAGDLSGVSFLDIGCGSGLFSLCAHRAGAAQVTSIDVDPESVAATLQLKNSIGSPRNWQVIEGSILDDDVVKQLGSAEVVYSWGVLHHTGDMDNAIRNAASLVIPGGLFCIAIYNRVTGRVLDSARWWRIKRRYNHAPRLVQRVMEVLYFGHWVAHQVKARNNPVRAAREYKASRGMALKTDLVDWLGGYPYEYATTDEVIEFCRQECSLSLVRVIPTAPGGTGNNQFVFRRDS